MAGTVYNTVINDEPKLGNGIMRHHSDGPKNNALGNHRNGGL